MKRCGHKLTHDAVMLGDSKLCEALFLHHHCLTCGFPINDEHYKDKPYCGVHTN